MVESSVVISEAVRGEKDGKLRDMRQICSGSGGEAGVEVDTSELWIFWILA